MRIWVVVACFNVEKFLDDFLHSILNQSDQDFNVIFVDDRSSDDTYIILQKFLINPIRKGCDVCLVNSQKRGASSARNVGINYIDKKFTITSEDYILFWDPDDILESMLINKIKSHFKVSSLDGIYYGYCCHGENGSIAKHYPYTLGYFNSNKQIVYELLPQFIGISKSGVENKSGLTEMASVWRFCYRLSLIIDNNIHFNTSVIKGEDLLFNCQFLSIANQILSLNEILYHYYIRKSGLLHAKIYDMDVLLSDKITTLYIRDELRNQIIERYNFDNLELYVASTAISIIGLGVSLANSNLKIKMASIMLKGYINYGSARLSRKIMLASRIPMKWRTALILSHFPVIMLKIFRTIKKAPLNYHP